MSQFSLRSLRDTLTIVRSYETWLQEEIKGKSALINAYINGCIFNHTYWLLSFKAVTFRDEQKEFMRDHYAEIRRKCLTAGWKSLKGNFRLTRAVRLLMVFLIPHHLIK